MVEEIIFILNLISQDFFIAFGVFTLLYFLLKIFIKNPILGEIDTESNRFISFIGILYFVIFIYYTTTELMMLNDEQQSVLSHRMFGRYWFGYWLQPMLWLVITQLLRIKRIRENVFIRIIFSFFLIFTIERIVIYVTMLNRDYLPSSWTMYNEFGFYPSNFILALFLKVIVFLVAVYLFRFIRLKILTTGKAG